MGESSPSGRPACDRLCERRIDFVARDASEANAVRLLFEAWGSFVSVGRVAAETLRVTANESSSASR